MRFLLLTLYAPLASWGEITVGENRGSWDRPSRSAILGLVAAALGLTRDDQHAHDRLDRELGYAVRLDAPGVSVIDFHTVQTANEANLRKTFGRGRPTTRREVLSVAELQTMVTRRELRQDALATAAIWQAGAQASFALEGLQGALRNPIFTLYAGRKSNPLAWPLAPMIYEAPSLGQAFLQRERVLRGTALERLMPRGQGWGREVAHDPLPENAGLLPVRQEVRRDAGAHRTRWQFSARTVHVGLLPETPGI